ncbi:3-oxoacyl-[acyl-carrier-protein] reductase FabG [Alphaproteobacteria bacterium SO-S41]|nr:3-oxoacyl-[acyl-carrier-protein] reductase FabG [Alphaproteobacteria bacterium SO-S41]
MTAVALLTDAASFIGPAVAARLRAGGGRVVEADASFADNGDAIAQTSPEETVAKAAALGGRLDALVISAAYPAPRTPAESLSAEATRPFFEKLAIEPLALAAAAIPHLKRAGGGRIVFVTSAGPLGGIPGFGAYAAARSAITGAVKSLALELAPDNISVNAVAPNYIQTEMYYPKAWLEDARKRDRLLARIPMGRLGEAEEAAEAVALLAQGRASFITGQILNISGGSS